MSARTQQAQFHDADLLEIGKHCKECGQLDFLPVVCNRCRGQFCKDHICGHRCSLAGTSAKVDEDKNVIICPICARGVEKRPHIDPNILIEEHCWSKECEPGNYSRVHERKRCPVVGCRSKLTTVNSYECRHCGISTCVKHRFQADHQCAPQSKGKSSFTKQVVSSFKRFFSIS